MPEFWTSCGYRLLKADSEDRLVVTEEFLQNFLLRPELVPVLESCAAERALHDRLLAQPRADVTETDLSAITDPDARENYHVWLRFRDRLERTAILPGV